MAITYDPDKNERNIIERNLSFERVAEFDFESAITKIDDRHEYHETRYISVGYLAGRLHVLCFVETGSAIRGISFRKANKREERYYEQKNADGC